MEIDIKGFKVLIDDEDYEKVMQYKWYIGKRDILFGRPYLCSHYTGGTSRSTLFMHRLIMGCSLGDDLYIDHINHDTLDNRKCNLRIVTNAQNSSNRTVSNKNNKSGYKGVYYSKDRDAFRIQIRVNYKLITVGQTKDIVEAAKMYDNAAIRYFGEYAHTNFPRECTTKEIK